ncbi:MAG: hypothetical protein AAFY17_03250 [Cyanobacteria bacterium J06642_11]
MAASNRRTLCQEPTLNRRPVQKTRGSNGSKPADRNGITVVDQPDGAVRWHRQ